MISPLLIDMVDVEDKWVSIELLKGRLDSSLRFQQMKNGANVAKDGFLLIVL